MCDCDETLVTVPLSLKTIVLPIMKPVYSINQKPKVVNNINKVAIETNYNQINELKVNNYIDGNKIMPEKKKKCKNETDISPPPP